MKGLSLLWHHGEFAARTEVERDPECRRVLQERQKEGWLPQVELYDDVTKFKPIPREADGATAGFPCQVLGSEPCVSWQ